jgi:molecular chaperone DnaK (HSP70)
VAKYIIGIDLGTTNSALANKKIKSRSAAFRSS